MKKFNWKYWVIPLVLVVGVFAAGKAGILVKANSQKSGTTAVTVSVTTTPVQYITKTPKLMLTGSVEGETSAVISSKISGRISTILVEDGQTVTAGQPLVQLESVELANSVRVSQEGVRRASANYDNISADYQRYLTLFNQSAISRQQLDSAETRLKTAEADLAIANATLGSVQEQYGYAAVVAPVSGVVANKKATIGQVVAAGVQLMTVESIGQVYAVVNVEQRDMGVIAPGLPAEITVDAYQGQLFSGKVEIVNPAAGTANRLFRVKIKTDNPDYKLKPGMFVKAAVVTGQPSKVLAVPQIAIIQRQGLSYVYIEKDGKAVRNQVELGQVIGDYVEIRSGLVENAQVITSNVGSLKDGDLVAVKL